MDGDDAAVIRTLYTGIITRHDTDPDLLRLMMFSALEGHPLARHIHGRSERLYRFLERFITEGQNRGRFRAGPPAVLARATLALPVYHVLQRHLFKTPWPAVRTADVIETGVSFTLAGLRTASLDSPDLLLTQPEEVRS